MKWHDRLFVAGQSSSGKSELLNWMFSGAEVQKILLDTKGEFAIDGIPITRRVEDIDWKHPVIHFQDHSGDLDEFHQLSYEVLHRRNVLICCHELADLCEDQPNRTPKWVRQHIRKGNVFGDGWLSGSQRPVGMPRQARTEAQHVIQMVPALDPEDHKIVAGMMGVNGDELRELIDQATALSPTSQYSWVWFERRRRNANESGILVMPPIPEHERARIIVRRTADV